MYIKNNHLCPQPGRARREITEIHVTRIQDENQNYRNDIHWIPVFHVYNNENNSDLDKVTQHYNI